MSSKLLLFSLLFSLPVFGSSLPDNLMIVAYDGQAWYPYVTVEGGWKKITQIKNPTDVTWQAGSETIFFKGDDSKLYRYNLKNNKPQSFSSNSDDGYTQLRVSSDRPAKLSVVKLIDGKSADTIIAVYDDATESFLDTIKQSSAQFHPYLSGNHLYYSHVSCRLICEPLIQDVWRHNLKTRKTEQLTRLNATTYLHSVSNNHSFGYISSNKNGFYNIAKLDLSSGQTEWLTNGTYTDTYPTATESGKLFFLRRTTSGIDLMSFSSEQLKLSSQEAITPLVEPLPSGVSKVRYLEFSK